MKLSVIIPAYRAEKTLPRTLESLTAASKGLDVETIVIRDDDGRGPSWARNRGLEQATGKYIFFVDADDTVKVDFLAKPVAAMERTKSDLCFFTYDSGPKTENAVYADNAAVRDRYLPAFFGYSFDDVKRWTDGGDLYARKEPGAVWRCAYRRDFLERNSIRFDESMTFYEDAAFLAHCAAFAGKAVSIADSLYEYAMHEGGNLASGWHTERHVDYKFRILEFRKRLDRMTDGALWRYCEASCAFTAIELLKMRRGGFWRYVKDPTVRRAIWKFPWLRALRRALESSVR